MRHPRQYNPADVYQEMQSRLQRHQRYSQMYTADHADRLGKAFIAYSWVNPEILASLVLNDADDLLPEVGRIVGEQLAKSRIAPAKEMNRYV